MADSVLVHLAELFSQCVISNANDRLRVFHAHTHVPPTVIPRIIYTRLSTNSHVYADIYVTF